MHIVAGTFPTHADAETALLDLQHQGVAPVSMNLIEPNDSKGFEREHRSTPQAALHGAIFGLVLGVAIFSALLFLASASIFELRYLALYLSGIAISIACCSLVAAFWNIGTSHDEALLYEEARDKHQVIAAIEVTESMEAKVVHALEDHGAGNVRVGNWHPANWAHEAPTYHQAA
jgi:hypothetical protein